jgi:hypothetical protein
VKEIHDLQALAAKEMTDLGVSSEYDKIQTEPEILKRDILCTT